MGGGVVGICLRLPMGASNRKGFRANTQAAGSKHQTADRHVQTEVVARGFAPGGWKPRKPGLKTQRRKGPVRGPA